MSKKNQYDRDEMLEQNDTGYYYPPMFRYPEDDEDARMQPQTKKPLMDVDMMQSKPGMEPGMKAGPSGTLPGLGISPEMSQMQPTVFDPGFLQAYLNRNIGKRVRIEFLIGTNILTDRTGTIEEVGISYVVLRDPAGSRLVCDLYSIKFITIFER